MLKIIILVAIATLVLVNSASAEPIQWTLEEGGNGHWYEIAHSLTCGNWCDIQNAINEQSFLDMPGYLVTITSQEEQNWIVAQYGCELSEWVIIGYYQYPGPPEPNQGWTWVTGESGGYTHWSLGEPSNMGEGIGVGENFAMFAHWSCEGVWNDVWIFPGACGYVIEYGEYDPEPIQCSEWTIPTDNATWSVIKKAYR